MKLELNRATGKYELHVELDAELFRRQLFRYAEENGIDPTDQDQWNQAILSVSNTMARVVGTVKKEEIKEEVYVPLHPGRKMSPEEVEAFKRKALDTPVDDWDSLLTPLLHVEASADAKRFNYDRRYRERNILASLRKDMEPMSRVNHIASAMETVRLH